MREVLTADDAGVTISNDDDGVIGRVVHVLLDDETRVRELVVGASNEVGIATDLHAERSGSGWSITRFEPARATKSSVTGEELERLVDHAYELRRMHRMERFPIGATLANGTYQLIAALRGGPDQGQYMGIELGTGRRVLVTVGTAQRASANVVEEQLSFSVPGVAALRHVGPLEPVAEPRRDCLVEELPPGRPASELVMDDRIRAGTIWLALAERVEQAHDQGIAFGGLRPELVFVADDGQVVLAPRCERFLATAVRPSYGVPSPFFDCYLAPESIVQPAMAPTPAADVFSLAAMLAHWWTGHHPFRGEGATQIMAIAAGQRRTWDGPETIATIFDDGLMIDIEARANLFDLIVWFGHVLAEAKR